MSNKNLTLTLLISLLLSQMIITPDTPSTSTTSGSASANPLAGLIGVPTTPSASTTDTPSTSWALDCDVANRDAKTRFDDSLICFHLMPLQIKVIIKVQVDTPSVARIEGTYELLKDKQTPINIIAQQQNTMHYSVEAPYIRNAENRVYPINVLNIVLKNGLISSYNWVNSCGGCDSNSCQKETLSTNMFKSANQSTVEQGKYERSNCYIPRCTGEADKFNCDPRIFITWSGTDKNKKYMTSLNKSPMMFLKADYDSIWKSMETADTTLTQNTVVMDSTVAKTVTDLG